MIDFKEYISEKDIEFLLSNSIEGKKSFRYFSTRKVEMVKSHVYNIIAVANDIPMAYGHLDKDENNNLWLGILVSDQCVGKGYGKLIMKKLIDFFMQINYNELYLTVDKENKVAQKLYEKFGFVIQEEKKYNFKYILRK